MQHHTLECERCGKAKLFWGNNADEIVKDIDNSGWEQTSVDKGLCTKCLARARREEKYMHLGAE